VVSDLAWVSLIPTVAGPGACELCAANVAERAHAVVVQHLRGGTVQLIACDRCVAAVRRLAAASGGRAHFAAIEGAISAQGDVEAPARAIPERVAETEMQLVHEFADCILDGDGTRHVVRVYGEPRSDGTWIGWLEFAASGAERVLRTGRETTQPSREHLAYWALGLEATYLEGAFARARRHATATAAEG
jgi:hypothetical protein